MSTAAAKRTNGKTPRAACVHSPGCPLVDEQSDIRAILEQMRSEQLELRNTLNAQMMAQQEGWAHVEAVSIDENEKTRAAAVSEVRELGMLVRALTKVLETRPCLVGAGCGQEG